MVVVLHLTSLVLIRSAFSLLVVPSIWCSRLGDVCESWPVSLVYRVIVKELRWLDILFEILFSIQSELSDFGFFRRCSLW